jgi:hypothetical protein
VLSGRGAVTGLDRSCSVVVAWGQEPYHATAEGRAVRGPTRPSPSAASLRERRSQHVAKAGHSANVSSGLAVWPAGATIARARSRRRSTRRAKLRRRRPAWSRLLAQASRIGPEACVVWRSLATALVEIDARTASRRAGMPGRRRPRARRCVHDPRCARVDCDCASIGAGCARGGAAAAAGMDRAAIARVRRTISRALSPEGVLGLLEQRLDDVP